MTSRSLRGALLHADLLVSLDLLLQVHGLQFELVGQLFVLLDALAARVHA